MRIRALRKLLNAVDEMSDAVVSVLADPDKYQFVLVDLAKNPERCEQFREALLDAIRSAHEINETSL